MSATVILLIILIPITVILIFAVIFIFLKHNLKEKRKTKVNELARLIRLERISKANAIISRVEVVIKETNEFNDMFSELEKYYEKLDKLIKDISRDYEDINANVGHLKKREFDEIYNKVISEIKDADIIEDNFTKVSGQITQQDEFLTSEHVFYSSHLRNGIELYRQKRILLNKISPKLDKLSWEINKKGKTFNEMLDSANNKEAAIHLRQYAKLVKKFIYVVSEAPKIESYIYITIPKVITSLTETYKIKKAELSAPLGHINFNDSLKKIANLYKSAKETYKRLDMKNTKKTIKKILRSVKVLERLINYEITSRNFFISNYESAINETKIGLQRYISLKERVRLIIGKGVIISPDLSLLMNDSKIMALEIDEVALSFRETMKNKTIPYSSKVSRMKLLLNKDSIFIEKLNEILLQLWSVNIESSIIKNKFKKSEVAINEVLANIKKQNISLTVEQEGEYNIISEKINRISFYIEKGLINKKVKDDVEDLMKNTASFYNVINGNIQIAEIVSNLIKEFAPIRATNQKLNFALNAAERSYLEGKYAQSLNVIITELEVARA